ncbi:LptF/LptG family permease [Candidatus Babeliales bacterium]|nr:LptF/LptG family permease [Candidatus Babeliales bacterium]
MVLALYFSKRFFKYFFLINVSLTFLFNFIEFFEKIVRIKHTSFANIVHFICLNLPSSFFENFPISCWLATCLFIKELVQQNEWETLQILNINYKKLFNLFLWMGIILASISFIGKEKITLKTSNLAEKFKIEKFKQRSKQKILNKWVILPNNNTKSKNLFCFFQLLDLKENKGTNIILIYMNSNFEIEKTINSSIFYIKPEEKTLFLTQGIKIKAKSGIQTKINNLNFKIPSFFSQLQLDIEIPSIHVLIKNLISGKNILPDIVLNNLLSQLLKRIIVHLQVLLYPLLTFCLFLLFPYHSKYKWVMILLAYPFITLSDMFINLTISTSGGLFLLLPYFFIIIFLLLLKKSLKKLLNPIK